MADVTQMKLIKVKEVAKMLYLSRSMVYRLIQQGKIPAARFGRAVRVPIQAVHEFIERNSQVQIANQDQSEYNDSSNPVP